MLQMLGGVRDRKVRTLRENVNGALALRKLLQQFEPMTMAERFRDSRELRKQGLLGTGR